MNLSESFLTALDNLISNKLRSILTMLGVIIGVGAVIALLAIGNGVSGSINNQIQGLGTNMIMVWTDVEEEQTNYRLLSMDDVAALSNPRNVPDVAQVAATVEGQETVYFEGRHKSVAVLGVTPNYFGVNNLTEPEAGRLLSIQDNDERRRTVVLGFDLAEHLFGEGASLGQQVRVGDTTYEVVGVLPKQGANRREMNNQLLMPLATAHSRFYTERTRSGAYAVSLLNVQARSEEVSHQAVGQITAVLRNQHGIGNGDKDDFRILSQQDLLQSFSQISRTMQIFLGSIAGISLLVGGIGIMNIMLVSVTERTREIGIRKALGALRKDILSQFLIEALFLSLIGGLIGILLGWSISVLAGRFVEQLTPIVQAQTILLATGFAAAVGIVFGIYPAWRAASLRPIEALRYE